MFIIYARGWYRRETNRKEKKTTTHPFDQPFFSLPNYCMTWIFILPNPISKLYKYFTYIYMHVCYYTLFQKYWVLHIHTDHTPPQKGNFWGKHGGYCSDMVSVLVYLKGMGSWSLVFFVGTYGYFLEWPILLNKGFSYFLHLKVCIENNLPNHRLC